MSDFLSILGLYNYDTHIFDELRTPVGIDKNLLINNICAELAELEILYPSANAMRALIGVWSSIELPVWERLLATTKLEYNPIENYDRIEEWDEQQNTENSGHTVTKNASYDNKELLETGGGSADTTGKATSKRKGRTHGNIGVTTSQQMIQAEREVSQFNMYEYITQKFKERFCILVY